MTALASYLLGTLVMITLVGGGWWILRLLRIRGGVPEGEFALSLSMGAGAYSYVFFSLGLAGFINTRLYRGILAIGLVLALPGVRALFGSVKRVRPWFFDARPAWFSSGLLVVLVICSVLAFVSSGAPVSDWDSREYHLGAPRRYIDQGMMAFHADDLTHDLFIGQSMLHLWILAIGPDSACQVLTWWFAVGLLCAVHAMARCLFSRETALLATSIVAAFAFFAERSIQPSPDMASTMMSLLIVYMAIQIRARVRGNSLIVMGMLAGFSVVFRMNSALILPPIALFAVMYWRTCHRVSWQRIAAVSFVGVLACMLTAAPWAIRNAVWTGNPVYPFMYRTFGGWMWNDRSSLYSHTHWTGTEAGFWERALPGMLKPLISIRFGSLALMCAPLCLFFKERRKECCLLGILLLSGWGVIARFALDDRYFAVLGPLGAVITAHTLHQMLKWPGGFRAVLASALGLIFVSQVGAAVVWHRQFIRAALGIVPHEVFLRETTGFYEDFLWMNRNLPQDTKVLLVFREEYYLDRPALHFFCGFTPQIGLLDFGRYRDAGEFARALQQAGVTHVFFPDYNDPSMALYWAPEHWSNEGLRLFKDLCAQHAELVRENPRSIYAGRRGGMDLVSTYLYRLIPPDDPQPPVEREGAASSARLGPR